MNELYKKYSAAQIIEMYASKQQLFWIQQEKLNRSAVLKKALKVPAYKKFLKAQKVSSKISVSDSFWQSLPFINKNSYFRAYSMKDLGLVAEQSQESFVMTSTSGSTGKPTYFFRDREIDWQYSVLTELFLKNGRKGSTLFINCFSMGIWIGGLITYQAFRDTGLRGYPLSIITPGINKKEIFNILREVAPNFDNVIFAGYPPFIKDIIDESKINKVNLRKLNVRLLFAAEGFSENFRNYIAKTAGIKNIYKDTLNIYGSAELGAMAFETPFSILIKRLALKNDKIFQQLFKCDKKIPTLAQYNPMFVNFESPKGQVLITASSATPFVRYNIGDNGGVLTYSEIEAVFKSNGISLSKEAKKAGVTVFELPFVYVHERADFSTTLYGLQIYPQTIKAALEHPKLQKHLSGKFTMNTAYDRSGDQYLELHLEYKPGLAKASKKVQKLAENIVIKKLIETNHEYRELSNMISKERTRPRLNFWEHNHPQYFKSGVKQQWLKKAK